jgi:hypothetical protein
MALPLIPIAIWVVRAYFWGQVIQEGNDIIKDLTSSKPGLNPTSTTVKILDDARRNPPIGGSNHQYVM